MSELARKTILPWVAMAALITLIVAMGTANPAQADTPETPEIQSIQTHQVGSTRTVITYVPNYELRRQEEVRTEVAECSTPHFIVMWSSVPGATSYTAQYREADSETWLNLRGQMKRGDSLMAGTLFVKVDVSYDVRIAAVKDGVTGEFATAAAGIKPDVEAPVGLSVQASDDYADTAILSWDNAPGTNPTHFALQHRIGQGQWGRTSIHQVGGDNLSLPVFNLQPDVEHHFRVAPQSAFCTYNNWSAASITLVRKPPTPAVEVEAGYRGNSPVITVTAGDNPRTDRYRLRYRQAGAGAYTGLDLSVDDAEAGHVIAPVSPSTEYEVGLAAVNQYGRSGYATGNVTTGEVIVLPVEPEFTLAAGYRNEATVITAAVDQHADENESYMLKFRRSGDVDWSAPVAVSRTQAAAGHVMDAEPDTGYEVAMAGVNGSRVSDYAVRSVRSETAWFVPDAPEFTATARHQDAQAVITVIVSNAQEGVTAYTLEITKQEAGASADTQGLTPAQATAGYGHAADHNATYSLRMSATGRNGDSPFSAARTVATPPPLPKQPEFTVTAGHSSMETVLTVTVVNADEHTADYVINTQAASDDASRTENVAPKADAVAGVMMPVEPDTQYSVSVTGRNSGGDGPPATTTARSLTPFPARPDATVEATYDERKQTILTVTVNSPDEHTDRYTVAHKLSATKAKPQWPAFLKPMQRLGTGYRWNPPPSTP